MGSSIITWLRANAGSWATVALEWAKVVWGWVAWAILAVWRSVVALIKSPAAWLACGLVFAVGFSVGHVERGAAVRTAKMRVAALEHEKTEMLRQLAASQAKVATLATALDRAAQKPAETPPAADAPPLPKKPTRKRYATPAPAKAAPAPTFRNPFGE